MNPDPLRAPGTDIDVLPTVIGRRTVSLRGHRARPMSEWLFGLAIGLSLGIPLGTSLAILLGRVDRWLDVVWER